jgi:hypothetical protein
MIPGGFEVGTQFVAMGHILGPLLISQCDCILSSKLIKLIVGAILILGSCHGITRQEIGLYNLAATYLRFFRSTLPRLST